MRSYKLTPLSIAVGLLCFWPKDGMSYTLPSFVYSDSDEIISDDQPPTEDEKKKEENLPQSLSSNIHSNAIEKKTETEKTDKLSDSFTNIPFIWVDFCVKENDLCVSGVSARQKEGIWEIDLSSSNLELLDINPAKFDFVTDDDGHWLKVKQAIYDEPSLKITAELGVENLLNQTLNSTSLNTKIDQSTYPLSASFNYNLAYSNSLIAFTDVVVGKKNVYGMTNFLWDQYNHKIEQGLTTFQYDQVKHHIQWNAWDISTKTSDDLGDSSLIKGIGFHRAFEQEPTLITIARPQLSGVIDRSGTLEVYSNDILLYSQPIKPGPFVLDNLSLSTGKQNIKLVLVDATGKRTTISSGSFYGGVSLLNKGLSDFGFYMGQLKQTVDVTPHSLESLDSDPTVSSDWSTLNDKWNLQDKKMNIIQGYYRRGISNRITMGVRAELSSEVKNYGLNIATVLPVGELSLSVGQSSLGGKALSGNYSYSSHYISLSAYHMQQDKTYISPSNFYQSLSSSHYDLIKSTNSMAVSFGFIPRVSLGTQYSQTEYYSEKKTKTASLNLSGSIKKAQWNIMLRQSKIHENEQSDITDRSISFLFSLPLENRRHFSTTVEQTKSNINYGSSFSQSRQDEFGLSYSLDTSVSEMAKSLTAHADYQTPWTTLGVQVNKQDSEQNIQGNLSGSLVYVWPFHWFVGPQLGSGFALIDAPGAPKAPVLRESTPVGKTNGKGFALIRNLTPFYPTKMGFDPDTLDIDVDTSNVLSKTILPTNRTATLVKFPATHAQAIQVQLLWPEGIPIKYGSIVFDNPLNETISLGSDGMLWLDKIEPGTYQGLVSHEKGTAQCTLVIPFSHDSITELSPVTCVRLTGNPLTETSEKENK